MADRFTRGWDGERHKGTRIATIYAKNGEADATIAPVFDFMEHLERCDLLQDAIGLLTREYEKCVSDMREANSAGRK
jgi:hypothetical protein